MCSSDLRMDTISKGKNYELLTPPYEIGGILEPDSLCLTDGEWKDGRWGTKNTVTWMFGSSALEPSGSILILIDLEENSNISRFGVAAVSGKYCYPPQVRVYVGEDMESFQVASEFSPQPDTTIDDVTDWFWSDELECVGRYVLFMLYQTDRTVPQRASITEVAVIGKADLKYRRENSGKKVTIDEIYYDSHVRARYFPYLEPIVETPHTKWSYPYHKGDPDILILSPYISGRDGIELAQRLGVKPRIESIVGRQITYMEERRILRDRKSVV